MATGKRKSSSGRKTSGRKTNSGRKKNDIQQESFTEEVILWVILAISILLFISNFGIGGAIGNAVSSFFFGVFGLIAYIFPVVLVIGTFFISGCPCNIEPYCLKVIKSSLSKYPLSASVA